MMPHYVNSLSHTDRDRIHSMIPADTRVLDLGCGDCTLLGELVSKKRVIGVGVDIDGRRLIDGMKHGLSVYQGDLDAGLADFPDGSFDYVILNQTLQVVKNPLLVIREMLRIGRHGIVGFPNFGHWRLRTGLFFDGRAPKSPTLPFEWYDTPNIRQLSITDFMDYCRREGIAIVREEYLVGSEWRRSRIFRPISNLLALIGIFVITRNREESGNR